MKIHKRLENSISVIFSFVFVICSFFTLFHFEKYPLGFRHSTLKTLLFAVLSFLLVMGYERLLNGSASPKANRVRVSSVFILLILQILLFLKIMTPIGWDALEVTNSAEFGLYNGDYFVRHTNNLFMQILLADYLKAVRSIGFLSALRKMELLNLLFVDAAICMAVITARKMYDRKVADRVFMCAVLLIGFHPTLSTVYSDTLAMPFPVGVLFCGVSAADTSVKWKRRLYLFLAGVLGVTGYYIKPTVLIIYIAMGILILLRIKRNNLNKQTLLSAFLILSGACMAAGLINLRVHPVKAELEAEYPDIIPLGMLHYIGVGLSSLEDDPSGYGGWNQPEVDWTNQHIGDADYPREALGHIWGRIADYGPVGYPGHLFNKLVWAGSDGTFFYGLEGDFHVEEQAPLNTLRGLLQNGFYIETEFYQSWFSSWMQGVWLMICIMGILSLFYRSESIYYPAAKLSVLGLFLFLLLFENRSRYLFLYLPVVLIAVTPGISEAFARFLKGHSHAV